MAQRVKTDWVLLATIGVLVVFGLVRPALKAATVASPAGKGGALNVVADGPVPLPGAATTPMLEAPRNDERLAGVRAIAKENPAAVANIVRGWVKGEAA